MVEKFVDDDFKKIYISSDFDELLMEMEKALNATDILAIDAHIKLCGDIVHHINNGKHVLGYKPYAELLA